MSTERHLGLLQLLVLVLALLGAHGCDSATQPHDRIGCSSPTTSSDGGSSSDAPAPDLPPDCDPTVGGRVVVVGLEDATGDGPTVVYMHGTYESPEGVLAWDSAAQAVQAAVIAEGGVMLLPRGREWWLPGGPWPWGAVTGDPAWMADDAELVADALACTPGDPDRVSIAGFSAGAIAAAYLGEAHPWASVVLWSGGLQPQDRPAHPDAPGVLAIHGGAADPYQTLVDGAIDYVQGATDLGIVCDHGGGHSTGLATDGALFLVQAHRSGHPWALSGLPTWTTQFYCEVLP